ncbi:restriction endonuclease subunit S [Tenacibaculum finnmarkense]|uniref:restriction endonuclease subunit S n=1 Tax=Tenacibaculum finnmarkense TaxID=2781243 RepID=UPI00187BB1F1|nr:restriction endonuclease subunit S [Tenacibaculum finnmarkense]MBE7697057.1 hypothetical protein [Tenacibaculum finnmarkense genomovar ulcerans]
MKVGYKKSALGEIPVDWEVVRLGDLASNEKHSFIDGDWIESPFITNSGVRLIQTGNIGIGTFIEKNKKYISEQSFKELRCKEIKEEDVLICRLASPVGRACLLPKLETKNITCVDVTICRPNNNVDRIFLVNYLNYKPTLNRMKNLSGGSTRQRINRTNLGNLKIPIPPLQEQQKIAEILSTVDAKISIIDEQISETQNLKKGLMQSLLSKGIGHTEFKKSALGEIPKSWEVKEINEVTSYVDYRGKTPPKVKEGILLVTAKNIKMGRIDYETSKEYIPKELYDEVMSRGIPKIGDILITTEAPLGNVASVDKENIALAQRVIKYRSNDNILYDNYLKYYMLSPLFQLLLEKESTGSTVKGIKGSRLHKLKVLIPPLKEQQKIASILNSVDEKLGVLSEKKSYYQNLKKGLMQQLLTGLVRVSV